MDEEPHRYSWPLLTFKSFTLSTFRHFHSFSLLPPLFLSRAVSLFLTLCQLYRIKGKLSCFVCVCVCVDRVQPLWPRLCACESQTVCEVTTATTVTVSIPPSSLQQPLNPLPPTLSLSLFSLLPPFLPHVLLCFSLSSSLYSFLHPSLPIFLHFLPSHNLTSPQSCPGPGKPLSAGY